MIRREPTSTKAMTMTISNDYAVLARARLLGAAAVLVITAAAALAAPTARAEFGFVPDSFSAGSFQGDGTGSLNVGATPDTRAGAHPFDAATNFALNTIVSPTTGNPLPDGGWLRDVVVELPAGFVGSPDTYPQCAQAVLVAQSRCPNETVVGLIHLELALLPGAEQIVPFFGPLYNMVPSGGQVARFGFKSAWFLTFVQLDLDPTRDYGVTATVSNSSAAAPPFVSDLAVWGVPADASHDPYRGPSNPGGGCLNIETGGSVGICPSSAPPRPFLTNPTSCDGKPVETTIHIDTWQNSGRFDSEGRPDLADPNWKTAVAEAPPLTGCEELPFEPQIEIEPTTHRPDSPTGLDVELTIPQDGLEDPDGLASAHLKDTVVTLPEGMSINPASADGLEACSDAQLGLRLSEPARCPQASKIGTVQVETPLLRERLGGSIYIRNQNSDDPASGELFRIAIEIRHDERGVDVKLPGQVRANPDTGQLETTFANNPQLPFSRFELRFKDGARAPLATPSTCGRKQIVSEFTSWAQPDEVVTDTDSFEITPGPGGPPCAASDAGLPFHPELSAGLVNPIAGTSSPFVLSLTRPDGHQRLLALDLTPPPGLTAVLRSVDQCPEPAAATGDCPANSKVGRSIVGAGAGSNPFYLQSGEVFLAGPYEGAPLSLVTKVPAVAGPFDLGQVVVRSAIHVDPRTAQLTVVSDPIPQIVKGVPTRVRDLRVLVDRPGFTVAPTNCEEMQVTAMVQGSHGASADLADLFQVGECASLGFSPKFRFRAKEGRRATKRNFHPTLEATVDYPPSQYDENGIPQANIDRVAVTLPKGVFLDQDNLATICTRAQFAADQCPEVTRVGSAEAETPLLDEPLSGPVYLIASDNKLPDIVADLNGIVDIDLYGRVDQSKRRIRNTFEVVPDAPVSEFRLTIDGGRNEGLLVNSRNTCRRPVFRRVNVRVFAHNGATAHQRTQVKAPCKSKKRKLRRKARQLRRKAHRLERRGHEAQAKKAMRRAHKLARRIAATRR